MYYNYFHLYLIILVKTGYYKVSNKIHKIDGTYIYIGMLKRVLFYILLKLISLKINFDIALSHYIPYFNTLISFFQKKNTLISLLLSTHIYESIGKQFPKNGLASI